MRKSLLLASFAQKDELYDAVEQVTSTLGIDGSQVFVFMNEKTQDEYILTYNLNSEMANIRFSTIWKNTISIHRKKHTNTLYSLNAMNELIKSKNNGYLNKGYEVNWSEYENSMMIIRGGKLTIIPIRLIKINQ